MLWVGAAAAAALQLLLQLVLARSMGPTSYGILAASLALVSTLAPIAAFGLPTFWLRVFGEEGARAIRWIPASVRLAGIVTIIVTTCLALWAAFGDIPEARRGVVAMLATFVAGQVSFELISSKLQLEDRFAALAFWQVIPPLTRLILVSLLWTVSVVSPMRVAVCFALVAGALVALAAREMLLAVNGSLRNQVESSRAAVPASPAPSAMEAISRSWIFALDALLFLVYMQSSVVILDRLSGSAQSGIYNAAFVMLMAVNLLPGVIYQKYFAAHFHRWASHDRERLRRAYHLGNRVMLVLGVGALASILIIAPWLIAFTFGREYEASANVLRILAFCIPLRFLSSNAGSVLITGSFHPWKVKVMACAAAINVVASLSLVPRIGVYGAAWSAVAAEAVVLIGLISVIKYRNVLHA